MPTFGNYETLRELLRDQVGALYLARKAGGGSEVYLREREINEIILGPDEADLLRDQFERTLTAVQQKTAAAGASAGGGHWAAVVDVGRSDSASYFASDRAFVPLRMGADRAWTGLEGLGDGRLLSRVALAVVNGLMELDSVCSRPHGNLESPGAVLIEAPERALAKDVKIVLSEPASEADSRDRLRDARQLAAMLWILGTRQGMPTRYPLPPEPLARVRRSAEWLALINDLADPRPTAAPPNLLALRDRIESLGGDAGGGALAWVRENKAAAAAVVALALVVGGGVAGWLSMRGGTVAPTRRETLATNPDLWTRYNLGYDATAALAAELDKNSRVSGQTWRRFLADRSPPGISESLLEIPSAESLESSPFDPLVIAGRTTDLDFITGKKPRSAPLEEVERERVPAQSEEMEERLRSLAERSYRQRFIEACAAWARAEGDRLAERMEAPGVGWARAAAAVRGYQSRFTERADDGQLIRDLDEVIAALRNAEEALGIVSSARRVEEAEREGVKKHFARWAAELVNEEESPAGLLDGLKIVGETAAAIETGRERTGAQQRVIERFERDRVRFEPIAVAPTPPPKPVEVPVLPPVETTDTRNAAEETPKPPPVETPVEVETPQPPPPIPPAPPPQPVVITRSVEREAIESGLFPLPSSVGAGLPGAEASAWMRDLRGRLGEIRREPVRNANDSFKFEPANQAEADQLDQSIQRDSDAYKATLALANRLAADAAHASEMLQAGYPASEPQPGPGGLGAASLANLWSRWTSGEFAEGDAPALVDALGEIRSRVKDIAELPVNPGVLVEKATDATLATRQPELVLEAYRRLRDVTGADNTQWPTTPDQLADDLRAKASLEAAARALRPEARATAVAQEVSDLRGERIASFLDRCATEEEWKVVARVLSQAGLERTALVPRHRMSMELVDAFETLRGAGQAPRAQQEEAITRAKERLNAAAGATGAGEAERRRVDAAIAAMDEARTRADEAAEQSGARPSPIPENGPKLAGWDARLDGEEVAYVSGGVELRFRRVPGTETWLQTTETSLGQVIAIVDRAGGGAWTTLSTSLTTAKPAAKPDEGASVWRWERGRLAAAPSWMSEPRGGASAFPPAGGNPPPPTPPSEQHPMQLVSGRAAQYIAALAGSRLPTVQEWEAARGTSGGQTPNLRDQLVADYQTWARQNRPARAVAEPPPHLRVEGTGDLMYASGVNSQLAPGADGEMLFRIVPAGSTGGFNDLVGNVAELVTDAAAPPLPGPVSIAGLPTVTYLVAGGSALSSVDGTEGRAIGGRVISQPAPARGFSDVGFRLAFTHSGTAQPERPRIAMDGLLSQLSGVLVPRDEP